MNDQAMRRLTTVAVTFLRWLARLPGVRPIKAAALEAWRQGSATSAASQKSQAAKRKKRGGRYTRASTQNLYDAVDHLRSRSVAAEHERVVAAIRARVAADPNSIIKVAFFVSAPARWNGDSILREIKNHPRMSADVVVRGPEYELEQEESAALFDHAFEFFQTLDVPVHRGYDPETGESVPVEDYSYDVYFFEMPWGMRDYPARVLGRGLPVYMHYGFMMMANHGMHYNVASFHSYLWRYFTQTETHRRLHLEHDRNAQSQIVVTGYPKLDVYSDDDDRENRSSASSAGQDAGDVMDIEGPVIYAPHHSLGKRYLGMSTFHWSGEVALNLAQQHSQLSWVYKPHPSLWYNVSKAGYMTAEEYEDYEAVWDRLVNASIYRSGHYFGLFRSSQALITCSGSFLAEYIPTGRPIIWLRSEHTVGFNRVGERLSEGFYVVDTPDELVDVFHDVVIRGNDPLVTVRARLSEELFPRGRKAGRVIVESLEDDLLACSSEA